jgi:hypothetical protein
MQAWQVINRGEPIDVMELGEKAVPEPGTGEVRIRVKAVALGESFTDYDCDCFEVKDGLITEIRAYATNEIDRKFRFVSKIEEFLATGGV